MPQSGYGATLVGTSLGSFTDVKDIRVGGLEVSVAEIATLGDTNRIPENLPTKVRESPIELTMVYDKTLYAALRTAAKARTEDSFTLNDAAASTHVGAGFVTGVRDLGLDTDNEMTYTVTLTPKTSWAFTPAA